MCTPHSSQESDGDSMEVLRMLAHKFSQPLTSLCGSVEVALMGELNQSECRQTLELALQESHRMAEVLTALRDVLEMEGCSEETSSVSWTQSVEGLLKEPSFANDKKGLTLVSDLQEEVWVEASPKQLEKATLRFFGRAIKAARGKSRIQIGLSVDGETACLSVYEEGPPAMAEPCESGSPSPFATELTEPAGLDDWIIRHAIERLGGGYRVIPMSETGLCYQLNLPVAPARVGHQP